MGREQFSGKGKGSSYELLAANILNHYLEDGCPGPTASTVGGRSSLTTGLLRFTIFPKTVFPSTKFGAY